MVPPTKNIDNVELLLQSLIKQALVNFIQGVIILQKCVWLKLGDVKEKLKSLWVGFFIEKLVAEQIWLII